MPKKLAKKKDSLIAALHLGFFLTATSCLLIVVFMLKFGHLNRAIFVLFAYSVLVTTFQLFRLVSAVFFPFVTKVVSYRKEYSDYEPIVSIVVPCMNEEQVIAHTLQQCFKAKWPKEKLEVIVINDGSTDRTAEKIAEVKKKYPELVVITFEKNRGKREGMAAGFRIAKGDIVVQLDSDSYIEPKTFANLITPFANPQIGAVCAHADVANADYNTITKMQSGYYYIAFRVLKAAESVLGSVFCCSGCSSAYRKSIVLPVIDNFLNEYFMGVKVKHGDDRSMTGWVLKAGYKTIYTDLTQAYTIAPHTVKQLFKQQTRWKKSWISNAYFTLKYIFKTDPIVGVFYFIPLLLISFLTPVVAFLNVYFFPILRGTSYFYYVIGGFSLTFMYMIYAFYSARNKTGRKYIHYFFLWQLLSITVFSYILYYSFFRFRDQRWGTR